MENSNNSLIQSEVDPNSEENSDATGNLIDLLSEAFGVGYSLRDEPTIWSDFINSNYDINLIAPYADCVCKENVGNIEFLENQARNVPQSKLHAIRLLGNFNLTSFANLAYLALNAPEPWEIAIK